jgi:ketosteroid isomerase-like protein
MPNDESRKDFIDRFLIREQIENYIDALNHRDWDRIAETMCDEFIWSAGEPFNLRYETKPVFVEMLRTVQSYQFGFVFQLGHGIVVRELIGNSAKVCHTLQIFGNTFECTGLYYDEMRKESDGIWRFVRRDYKPTYHDSRNVPGKIYRQLPDPNYHNLPGAE